MKKIVAIKNQEEVYIYTDNHRTSCFNSDGGYDSDNDVACVCGICKVCCSAAIAASVIGLNLSGSSHPFDIILAFLDEIETEIPYWKKVSQENKDYEIVLDYMKNLKSMIDKMISDHKYVHKSEGDHLGEETARVNRKANQEAQSREFTLAEKFKEQLKKNNYNELFEGLKALSTGKTGINEIKVLVEHIKPFDIMIENPKIAGAHITYTDRESLSLLKTGISTCKCDPISITEGRHLRGVDTSLALNINLSNAINDIYIYLLGLGIAALSKPEAIEAFLNLFIEDNDQPAIE